MALNDDSLMPNGKYKGEKMANVPAKYLLWCYENGKCNYLVSKYVHNNYDILKQEADN